MNKYKNAQSRKSFTLAEMLITLTVVSILAIMTIPQLFIKVDDFKWNSARQKMVYNIREATRRMAFENAGGISGFGTTSNFRDQLSKYLATAKSCNVATDCFSATIKNMAGNSVTTPTTGADLGVVFGSTSTPGAARGLILSNGAGLNIIYHSDCIENDPANNSYGADHVCANIIYDINGFAPPNQTGKDIGFVSIIDPKTITVAGVSPDKVDYTEGATDVWDGWDIGALCGTKGAGWYLPTKDELNSLSFNKNIIGNLDPGLWYWSSTELVSNPSTKGWNHHIDIDLQCIDFKNNGGRVRCVRK